MQMHLNRKGSVTESTAVTERSMKKCWGGARQGRRRSLPPLGLMAAGGSLDLLAIPSLCQQPARTKYIATRDLFLLYELGYE